MPYAQRTKVPVDRSKQEIERLLEKYKASGSRFTNLPGTAMIEFMIQTRQVRFILPLPEQRRYNAQTHYEQALRERWRALTLAIKAKLEIVESKISDFDTEFMPYTVMPGTGKTVAELLNPQINLAYEGKTVQQLLLPGPQQNDS